MVKCMEMAFTIRRSAWHGNRRVPSRWLRLIRRGWFYVLDKMYDPGRDQVRPEFSQGKVRKTL